MRLADEAAEKASKDDTSFIQITDKSLTNMRSPNVNLQKPEILPILAQSSQGSQSFLKRKSYTNLFETKVSMKNRNKTPIANQSLKNDLI